MAKFTPPEHLKGATDFDGEVNDPLWLVKTLKGTGSLAWDELKKHTTVDKNRGRDREPGDWALAFLTFLVSEAVDIQPWWEKHAPEELWVACGFEAKPAYRTCHERFAELEEFSSAFVDSAAKLIQHCRKHEKRIGQYVHVDSCDAETDAALIHDDEGCGCGVTFNKAGKRERALRPHREATTKASAERQKAADAPADENELLLGAGTELEVEDDRVRVKVGSHWYFCRDATAGARAYTGKKGAVKFWNGFYNQKAIDHFTGAPLAVIVSAANVQEYHSYHDVLETMNRTLGRDPLAIVADKGFAVESVFETNTSRGIATVTYFRKTNQSDSEDFDFQSHDRHGVPRCKHCGSPTSFVRFAAKPYPCLWVQCNRGTVKGSCDKTFRVRCSLDWRRLLPLWRTDIVYQELLASHGRYERVHHHWRERYRVAGNDVANRPKRIGRKWQQLRANAALLVEWLRIAWREGWLGSARKNKNEPVRADKKIGEEKRKRLLSRRSFFKLHLPYGKLAAKLGIGHKDPPSAQPAPEPEPPPPDKNSAGGESASFEPKF
jgi:hypothetical protein